MLFRSYLKHLLYISTTSVFVRGTLQYSRPSAAAFSALVSQDLDWEPIRRQHRRILEAIKRGDTDTASYLAETHLHLMPEEQGPVIALHPDYFELSKDSAI